MRLSHGFVPLLAVLIFLTSLPAGAVPSGIDPDPGPERATRAEGDFGRSGAECRTSVEGAEAVTYCHNPYPAVYRVSLHIECVQWWDIDFDGSPVEVGPAGTVRLTGRCWEDIASVWVTEQRV